MLLGLLIVAAIIYGFMPEAIPVQTATVKSGPFQVIVEEEGKTQVEHQYVVSSPVAAYARRIKFNPGEVVQEGSALVELEPPRSIFLDSRSKAEALARVEAAEASLQQMESQAEQATKIKERMERLARKNSATSEQVEQATAEAASAVAARNAAQAELTAAQALVSKGNNPGKQPVEQVLTSPASGQILAVHKRSEGFVNAGEPLLEIGNIEELEVQVDVLSRDAISISSGMRVLLDQWGGESPLEGVVKRMEKQGKMVVSALGVEEQRVKVIVALKSSPEIRAGLGAGYRVLAQFIIWEDEDVLQVPNSALFRTGEGWGVFVVEKGLALQKKVNIGQQTGLTAQVLEGLAEGELVVVHPSSELANGVEVEIN